MSQSSRSLAQSWGYTTHRQFVGQVQESAASWFRCRGLGVSQKYPYILEQWNDWPHNIILPAVADYISTSFAEEHAAGRAFPLHKYLHHGLSSQAMLFNLVGPLIVQGNLDALRNALARKGCPWPGDGSCAAFEYEDRTVFNEDSGQPTSVDLVVKNAGKKPRIFIEAKFTEQEFGRCSVFGAGDCDGRNPAEDHDDCYLHHIGRRYWSVMQKHGIDNGPIGQGPMCMLANYYQFFREAVFAFEHEGVFALLCDERSPVFYSRGPRGQRGIMPFMISLLPEQLRQKVFCVTVQELVAEIELLGDCTWSDEFRRKYGLARGPTT